MVVFFLYFDCNLQMFCGNCILHHSSVEKRIFKQWNSPQSFVQKRLTFTKNKKLERQQSRRTRKLIMSGSE